MTHLNIADTPPQHRPLQRLLVLRGNRRVVQEEPVEALDPERAGRVAAIGIVKGKPFAPDERLRGLLAQAAPIAAGIARALVYKPRDPAVYLYPGSRRGRRPSWAGVTRSCGTGRDCSTPAPSFHYFATVITPRRWRPRRSAPDRSTHTRRRTRQGPGWTAGAPTGRDCPPAFRRRTSGRWTCTTPSIPVAPADRQPLPGAEQPARNGHRQRRRLHRPPLRARRTRGQGRRTGSRPCPESRGSGCCACTGRWSRGSTGRGGPASSSPSKVPTVGDAIGQMLASAVGIAISPVPLIAVVLMLATPARGRSTARPSRSVG